MSVKLREKILKTGNISLYLDIYHKGKRKYEFLNLHIIKPAKTQLDRQHNKEVKELASQIRAKKEIELQSQDYDHSPSFKRKTSFIEFARVIADEKRASSKKAYRLVIRKIEVFIEGKALTFEDINKKWCEKFYKFLLANMSINAAYDYYGKFTHFLTMAVKRDIIAYNPADKIDRKKREDTQRMYLTFEEVQSLVETPCKRPELKRAFLFSCLTGLRWSDVKALTWGAVCYSEHFGYYIDHKQIKTRSYETLPISEQAVSLCGKTKKPKDPVFPGIYYSTIVMRDLKMWALQAGITKEITFHTARHTFATLQLTNGADISVVSKLLGHKDVSVTQVYARVIDKRKREAMDNLPRLKFSAND